MTEISIGENEKNEQITDKQYVAVSVTQYNSSLSSFVPNFRILTQVVAEKSLTEKKFTNKQTQLQKRQKLYTPDILRTGGMIKCWFVCFCCFTSKVNSYGHCGTVSSLNHTFSWAGLNKRLTSNLCTQFRL